MANVFIFSFFSKQLEKKVFDDIISQAEEIDTEDLINELK
jgi:hypothetical protein